MVKVIVYQTPEGKEPFNLFLSTVKSKQDRARIISRIDRIERGNLGDSKSLGEGLFELRFFFGQGYRVYFGVQGTQLVILLCGGDKGSQAKDIKTARLYWKGYLEEMK